MTWALQPRCLPRENSDGQSQYDGRGDDPELSDEILDVVTFLRPNPRGACPTRP